TFAVDEPATLSFVPNAIAAPAIVVEWSKVWVPPALVALPVPIRSPLPPNTESPVAPETVDVVVAVPTAIVSFTAARSLPPKLNALIVAFPLERDRSIESPAATVEPGLNSSDADPVPKTVIPAPATLDDEPVTVSAPEAARLTVCLPSPPSA